MSQTAFQIRKNAQELKDYLKDLQAWESEIKRKDKAVKQQPANVKQTVPVRGQNVSPVSNPISGMVGASTNEGSRSPSKEKIKAYDYGAWDRFDVDKALETMDKPANVEPSVKSETDILEHAIEEALLEKEKGNAWFKKGDFKRATACYTKAMQLDTKNAVLPINRAMAHLKLNKFAEAESDCTEGLRLDPKNVKAFWRRGIARRELAKYDEARRDFESALVLEPANKAVGEDLSKLLATTRKNQDQTDTGRILSTIPMRRRLEIEEVSEDELGQTAAESVDRSTQSALLFSKTIPDRAYLETTRDKSASTRESLSPAHHPVKPTSAMVAPKTNRKLSTPRTMFEFERDWKSLKSNSDALYAYFKGINPADYCKIFKNSLEGDYVSKVLELIALHYKEDNLAKAACTTLKQLASLPRFDMVVMFLTKKDKEVLGNIIAWLSSSAEINAPELERVRAMYKCK